MSKLRESNEGDVTLYSLKVLAWIPKDKNIEEFIMGYLKEKEPKIGVMYAIKINKREEAASFLKTNPKTIDSIKSPKIVKVSL